MVPSPCADGARPVPTREVTPRLDLRVALLAGSLLCTLVWLRWGANWQGSANPALLGAALALHGSMWVTHRRAALRTGPSAGGGFWSLRSALCLVAVVLAIVAVMPLHHSRDLFLYDIYGRAVVEHHVSPYATTPAQLHDPDVDLVASTWHDQLSMYGPAFVAVASAVSRAGGDSELRIRLVWQALMAGAAMAAVVLVARRTRDPMAVLVLGCSPVLLATVNDAHNDMLIGLGLLAVVLLVDERRYAIAGAIGALVIATKVPAAVPLAAVGAWVLWRRGWRSAAWFAAPMAAATTVAYLAVGVGEALRPLRENAGDDSRFAIWQPLRDQRFEHLLADGMRWRPALETVRDQMSTYSLVLLVVSLAIVAWRYRRAAHPDELAGIAGFVLMVSSTYVMPWYPPMVLPVVALAWRSRASRLVQVQAAFLLFAYAQGPGRDPTTTLGRIIEQRAVWINVALLLAALCWSRPSRTDDTRAALRRSVGKMPSSDPAPAPRASRPMGTQE